jgi:hypothetical protein
MLDVDQGPPRSLASQVPAVQVPGPGIQVLFAEARRRRKRRRLRGAAVGLILAVAVASGVIAGSGGLGPAIRGSKGGPPAGAAKTQASRLAPPSARLAWLDNGVLMVGDPATGALRTGPTVDASASAPLVFSGGRLYWADSYRDRASIREYDLVTDKIRYLPRGLAVFASVDGRHLYIARSSRVLLELPADGSGRRLVLRAPAGWHLAGLTAGWVPTQAAGGFIVASRRGQGDISAREGLWNPATGQVRILGTRIWIFGAYTPPAGRYSLLAWAPANREFARDDSLRITNTATGATVLVRSPLHHGFTASGAPAFSPGGRQLAVFVRTARLGSESGMSQLAIVNSRTGALRLVPGTVLDTTEDAFWAVWLPGGQRILAGAVGSAYLADARTLAVGPFAFFDSSADGFSAVVLSVPRKS